MKNTLKTISLIIHVIKGKHELTIIPNIALKFQKYEHKIQKYERPIHNNSTHCLPKQHLNIQRLLSIYQRKETFWAWCSFKYSENKKQLLLMENAARKGAQVSDLSNKFQVLGIRGVHLRLNIH